MNATYIANAKKNIVVQIYFNPLKSGGFYREYFLKLRGSVFVCDWPTAIKRPPSILKKALFTEGSSKSAEAAKAMGHKRCPLILENTPQFWKTDYPWKMQAILGLRKLQKWLKLFPPSQIHIIRFAKKKLVKNDQPSPQRWSEGNTAAYVGSSPPTRYDQHKEPMIDTKII